MDTTSFDKTKTEIDGPMHTSLRHDSAHKHVTGSAEYIDDIPEPAGLIHGALGMADRAHAEIVSMDLSEVEATPGVLWVMTGKDVPGENDISSGGRHDEPLLAEGALIADRAADFRIILEGVSQLAGFFLRLLHRRP